MPTPNEQEHHVRYSTVTNLMFAAAAVILAAAGIVALAR